VTAREIKVLSSLRKRNKGIDLRVFVVEGGGRQTLKLVSLECRSLRVTEESPLVLKVGQGGDLTMTAESRRRKAVPPLTICAGLAGATRG